MLKFLKWVRAAFWVVFSLLLLAPLVFLSIEQSATTPHWDEIVGDDRVMPQGALFSTGAVAKSRKSAVMIQSTEMSLWGGTSTMTGTYFVAKNKHYVITVHHGIHGPCWLTSIIHDERKHACKEYILLDEYRDYAIIELTGPISDRTPIRIPLDLPHGEQWKKSYSILNNIVYTGYPNTLGPLTLRGDVVGYGEFEELYVFSHAYGGSSGSGVFTADGKYIGHIVAIDVGSTQLGVDVLENIVIVVPAFNIDWSAVLN
jgi:hypothetical protein